MTTATRTRKVRRVSKSAVAEPQAHTNRQKAEALFCELREAFSNAERVIIEIIQTEAWLPLGYDTFAEAWAAKMQGVRLASDAVKAHVVYALLDTVDDEEVIAAVNVTPGVVKGLRRQKAAGVPAGMARIRTYVRRLPSRPRTVHVTVSEREFAEWSSAAEAVGSTLAEEAAAALRAHFEGLGA